MDLIFLHRLTDCAVECCLLNLTSTEGDHTNAKALQCTRKKDNVSASSPFFSSGQALIKLTLGII